MTTRFNRRNTAWAPWFQCDKGLFCPVWLLVRWYQGALLEEAGNNLWETQRFRFPKALPATHKRGNFGVFWTCSVAYSSGFSAQRCAKTHLFNFQSAGSQLAEVMGRHTEVIAFLKDPRFALLPVPLCLWTTAAQQANQGALQKAGAAENPWEWLGTEMAVSDSVLGAGLGNHRLICSVATLQNQQRSTAAPPHQM